MLVCLRTFHLQKPFALPELNDVYVLRESKCNGKESKTYVHLKVVVVGRIPFFHSFCTFVLVGCGWNLEREQKGKTNVETKTAGDILPAVQKDDTTKNNECLCVCVLSE